MREQGRYGPGLAEVLPAIAGFAVGAAVLVLLLVQSYRVFGAGGPALGLVLLALLVAVAVPGLRWRRVAVRRRGGVYTPAEIEVLDDDGLAAAAERILRRDGWRVIAMPSRGRPRLFARDRGGRLLDVGFHAGDEPADEDTRTGPATLRMEWRTGVDDLVRVVINKGAYSAEDVRWAARRGGVRLIDGPRLRRWAAGTPLDDLGLPGLDGARHGRP
ncbi:hypothetical protein AB0J21_18720 [Streptomyces sp. NPDC049954]|uniref:hypothetical protein n=1 Tax=Streptomyces sp. NPDC049954 TaxID=3155779 RepID=UPI0034228628